MTTEEIIAKIEELENRIRELIPADLPADLLLRLEEAEVRIKDLLGMAGSAGDMKKSVYDTDGDSVVDNSEKLEGSTKTQVQDHTPKAHKASHENGGGDEISVAGLSGELADNQPPKSHALNSHSAPTGNIAMSSKKFTGLVDPTANQDSATKKYVDDNAGGVQKLYSKYTNLTIDNSNVQQDIFTFTLPGGTLGTNNIVRAKVFFKSANRDNGNLTINFTYDNHSLSLVMTQCLGGRANEGIGYIEGWLMAKNSASAQKALMFWQDDYKATSTATTTYTDYNERDDYTKNSANDLILKMTAAFQYANANNQITFTGVIVEKVC